MLSSPASNPAANPDAGQVERLPNFMLSNTTPAPVPRNVHANPDAVTTPPWLHPTRRQTHPVAFNDRLATPDQARPTLSPPADAPPTLPLPAHAATPSATPRPPSRMPPNKSLLDSGPPAVLSLRTPSTSAPSPLGTGTAARSLRTPTSASPARAGTERWVTVFGFPPAMESQVLREFRRHGDVVRTVPGKGNWVHILYRTPLQAQVALYKPWRLLAGTDTMVGTVPCTEPHLAKETDDQIERGIMIASPSAVSPFAQGTIRSPAQPHSALRTPSSLLRRDPGSAATVQSIVRTPQRQSGILDYLTGFYK